LDIRSFWAKSDKRGHYHPLVFHSMDVGNVAEAIWDEVFSEVFKDDFAKSLGLREGGAGRWIAYWASLHDAGKLSPAFQRKDKDKVAELKRAGLDFPVCENPPHNNITAKLLNDRLRAKYTDNDDSAFDKARLFTRVLGGHHGTLPQAIHLTGISQNSLGKSPLWEEARDDLVRTLTHHFNPPDDRLVWGKLEAGNAIFLAGFISVADWIGSISEYFPFADESTEIEKYFQTSKELSLKALLSTGWLPVREAGNPPSKFEEVSGGKAPRPSQKGVINVFESRGPVDLLLLEWPTGEGKTEAAFWATAQWLAKEGQKGFYIALPTQATSNQMWLRTSTFLTALFPDADPELALIHGYARLFKDDLPKMNLPEDEFPSETASWFLNRKRSLLQQFGVGTIDQALFSVLQIRHFFVRLFGLAGKTVVLDEVHAYDTYTSDLILRLLEWLRALNTKVILLSATLPSSKRGELIRAYSGDSVDIPDIKYPMTIEVRSGVIGAVNFQPAESYSLGLGWLPGPDPDLADWLGEQLEDGGCAAVILNTIRRAQSVYKGLNTALRDAVDVRLLHSRFPYEERQAKEKTLAELFGPPSDARRPQKSILVATQVIEQSLDVDFDILVSDLAPADLLLQRAGRLHRHDRGERTHPRKMWIIKPEITDEVPDVKSVAYVYEEYIVLKTWQQLQEREEILIPGDVSSLIDAVYENIDESNGRLNEAIAKARTRYEERRSSDARKAKAIEVESPNALEYVLTQGSRGLLEDDPTVHSTLRAATRLGGPSVQLACLRGDVQNEREAYDELLKNARAVVKWGKEKTNLLLRRSCGVSTIGFVNRVLNEWDFGKSPLRNTAALRYHIPVIFEDGANEGFEGYRLVLDEDLGLVVERTS